MNPPNRLPDLPNDSDVERIKARIREQRFVLFDKWRMLVPSELLLSGADTTAAV